MERVYIFLIRNDVWIYILCALGLFWYASEYLRARRILRRAMFGLEWETGTRIRNNALGLILLFSTIIGAIYYVNTRIAPTIPPERLRPPTPTSNIFATPLSSPTPLGTPALPPPNPTPPLVPTITLPSQGNAQPPSNPDVTENESNGGPAPTTAFTNNEPEAAPTPIIGCTIVLNINEPRDGAVVAGSITFFGTAATPDFSFYNLEANGPETGGQWASLLGRSINQPVRDSFLGSANLEEWAAGPYLIRLTAVDTNNNVTGQCVIQVTLDNR